MTVSEMQLRWTAAKVLVVGDLMLDEYWIGSANRISPEAPVPVVEISTRSDIGGGSANVAANILSLGGSSTVAGFVGCDAAGERLHQILVESGANVDGLVNSVGRKTICKTRIVAGQQQVVRLDQEDRSPMPEALQVELLLRIAETLPHHDVCVLSDYAKGTLSESVCRSILEQARILGKPVIVDPKGRSFEKYRGCTVISPNLFEAGSAVGMLLEEEASVLEAGSRLLELLPGSHVLITRGADGMTLFSPDLEPLTIPALARKVFNVVGAGDTVVSALALACASGLSLKIAVRLANLLASIVVGKPGTATITAAELFTGENKDHLSTLLQLS